MLTYSDLKAIQEGNKRNADILDLLREIKRLRGLVVDSCVMFGRWRIHDPSPEMMTAIIKLNETLRAETCVIEHERMVEKQRQIEYVRNAAMLDNRPPEQRN
ncbi:MAG: hypothetical protein EPN46_01005 [Candidimonas sp.]|nr:MAG: hypothetical protein EPN62_02765 [Candidimonas sp.]TAM80764.1 MAG: hypothetical protein EPN46_01005 [Candidimonas sp.]